MYCHYAINTFACSIWFHLYSHVVIYCAYIQPKNSTPTDQKLPFSNQKSTVPPTHGSSSPNGGYGGEEWSGLLSTDLCIYGQEQSDTTRMRTPHTCTCANHIYIHAYDNTRKVWIMLENLNDNLLAHYRDRSNRWAPSPWSSVVRTCWSPPHVHLGSWWEEGDLIEQWLSACVAFCVQCAHTHYPSPSPTDGRNYIEGTQWRK